MDINRLIALLNLTTSDNDNEALSAIRHANSMLKKNNLTWNKMVGITSSYTPPPKSKPSEPPKNTWKGGFAPGTFEKDFVVNAYQSTQFNDYLKRKGGASLKWAGIFHTHFMKYGTLSERQYKIFEEIWNDFIGEKM